MTGEVWGFRVMPGPGGWCSVWLTKDDAPWVAHYRKIRGKEGAAALGARWAAMRARSVALTQLDPKGGTQ